MSEEIVIKPGDRVFGPYAHRRKFRNLVRYAPREGQAGQEAWLYYDTFDEADRHKVKLLRQALGDQLTVSDAIERYVQETKINKGRREETIKNVRSCLRRFFAMSSKSNVRDEYLGAALVAGLTEGQVKRLFNRQHMTWSADTSHSTLHEVKAFGRWLVDSKQLRDNIFDGLVEERPKVTHNKTTLTIDEAEKFRDYCVALGEQALQGLNARRDRERLQRATVGLCAFILGMRASEITGRVVKSLDKRGTVLRVEEYPDLGVFLKTRQSKRNLALPPELQRFFSKLAEGKMATDFLFVDSKGQRKNRQWVNKTIHELSLAAGVTEVCPHGLRHTHATASEELSLGGVDLMRRLGQKDMGQTRDYIGLDAQANAGVRAVESMLKAA